MKYFFGHNKCKQDQLVQEQQDNYEFDGIIWDFTWNPPRQLKIKIQIFCCDNVLQYYQSGAILRTDKISNLSKMHEFLTNLEQIKHLNWIGKYGQNNLKIGKWIATWNNQILNKVGGFYTDGKKQGYWKEITKNFWIQVQIYEVGEYFNNKRHGNWKQYYKDEEIGGGTYNLQGERNGKWIEVSDGFGQFSQIVYMGEYKNGKKISRWENLYRPQGKEHFRLIFGAYDEKGDQTKVGKWIESSDEFKWRSEVTYQGFYKNDKKIGRWDIFFNNENGEKEIIGGGSYHEEDYGNKIGKWIEVSDGFGRKSQVIYSGLYINGKKVGRWHIYYNKKDEGNKYELIGGGSYHENGNEIKIGNWIELREGFWWDSQITYNGEYQDGKKVGQWDILYSDRKINGQRQVGGGLYDKGGNGNKNGKWIELSDGFMQFSQVTHQGEYKNGKKFNKWDIYYNNDCIGGGSYNEEGIKIGKWNEAIDGFGWNGKITYNGEYKDGRKVGTWEKIE